MAQSVRKMDGNDNNNNSEDDDSNNDVLSNAAYRFMPLPVPMGHEHHFQHHHVLADPKQHQQ